MSAGSQAVLDSVAQPKPATSPAGGGTSMDVLNAVENEQPGAPEHPPLTPEEVDQLKQSVANMPAWRKFLGLRANDPTATALEQKNQDYQVEQMAKSPIVRQQLRTAATGTGIIAAAPVAGAAGAGLAAVTAPTTVAGTVGTGVLDSTGAEIMKDVTTMGPSIAKVFIQNPVVQNLALKGAGLLGLGWLVKIGREF